MDSFDPQQIAEDREIVAEAVARARIRPLFRSGESTAAGATRKRNVDDQTQDAGDAYRSLPIGEDAMALGSGYGEGP